MISIGIDVSKCKSTMAIINVMRKILQTPFDIEHSQSGLNELFGLLKNDPKDQVQFIVEATGIYHLGGLKGMKRATLAVTHFILIAIYYVLKMTRIFPISVSTTIINLMSIKRLIVILKS